MNDTIRMKSFCSNLDRCRAFVLNICVSLSLSLCLSLSVCARKRSLSHFLSSSVPTSSHNISVFVFVWAISQTTISYLLKTALWTLHLHFCCIKYLPSSVSSIRLHSLHNSYTCNQIIWEIRKKTRLEKNLICKERRVCCTFSYMHIYSVRMSCTCILETSSHPFKYTHIWIFGIDFACDCVWPSLKYFDYW